MITLTAKSSQIKQRLLLLVIACLFPVAAWADQLEVRNLAAIYTEPDRHSEEIVKLDPSTRQGPYLIKLLSDEKSNGFYHVRVPGKAEEGWVYKTYVRRVHGQHPAYIPYDRTMYRHWIKLKGSCQDTRNRVLVRDATGKIKYSDPDECKVAGGIWRDPYSGATIRETKQIDIDHMVPLKNAHESGAWTWSAEKKKEYANYLEYEHHLLAVSASENRRKSDRGPDKYLPPLPSYRCTYVKDWIKIKNDWELEMSDAEQETVDKILAQCH